jgi:hypothetical protein
MYIGLHVKYQLFLSYFNKILFFQYNSEKNTHVSDFIKIRLLEAELFYANKLMDRRTERHDKANSRFSQFCVSTKNLLKHASNKKDYIVTCFLILDFRIK